MIAHPHPSTVDSASDSAAAAFIGASPLSATELYQLTLYKWRYALEAYGFVAHEVRELVFLKWLYASRRIDS